VKICDPAIGSGAFPMGILQEIFNAQIYLQELKGLKKINDADIKKHIIEESIYGVDIDAWCSGHCNASFLVEFSC
jgi:adenine-specific DNA-methyltransferase